MKCIRDFGFVGRSARHDRVASVSGDDYLTGRLLRKDYIARVGEPDRHEI